METNISFIPISSDSKKNKSDENIILKKEFIPRIKPKEIHLVPSKLKLNTKSPKYNKVFSETNNCFVSCPNSEDESYDDGDDTDSSPKISNNIISSLKSTRKSLQKMKSGTLPKIQSRNLIKSNCKMLKADMEINSDLSELDDSFELKEDDYCIYGDNNLYNSDKKDIKRPRSYSILEVLKNEFNLDDNF